MDTKEKHIVTHGREFTGVVISAKAQRTVTVEWDRTKFVQKYERYLKARTRVKAHNPDSIAAQEADVVRIKECRPISKTKCFIVVEKVGKDYAALERSQKAYEAVDKEKEKKLKEEGHEAN